MIINGTEFLTTEEAATVLGLRPSYLTKLRVNGQGPVPFYVGRAVLYLRSNVERELKRRRALSRG